MSQNNINSGISGNITSPEEVVEALKVGDKAGVLVLLRNVRLWLSEKFELTVLACGIVPDKPYIASMTLEIGKYMVEFNVTPKEYLEWSEGGGGR